MRIGVRSILLTIAIVANGLLAPAQVPTFTPVTEAMLLNPDPDDWLNWRRTPYSGSTAARLVVGDQLRRTT